MKGQLVRKAMVMALSMFLIFSSFHAAFAEMEIETETKAEAPADLKTSWASKALQEWWTKEWIHGYPDGTFRPDSNITRAEFMTLVNQVLGLSAKADLSFRDLPTDNWAFDQIAIAV
ncbi:S-layer homology domain-containing protein [Paenibacillus contaminans]|uniref:SLH domain-containing protein n=1 Tax=Paenibacillus contaminans TaxID=450362 RepID=A0A329LUY3_9BACL|nr:S-layer homology domain-containing protein [Paenibacillus contaminans]RAV10936.1 hypothetical protein DQG23_37125 [Paenibacillus contaminans]